ncbi:efflux RND transporter periplasmic adaptor subunit [Marinicella rhabdoformis]|uniref:efflux RND transporter periplasmic adaptor subunit n=1 Tax=Marinicella rhabdoformis TaxID=2580566 RepID=UPI0012AEC10A|nr:efflux RND transporter periplasmic adaptor subunit [Marinicella rhabdoformis]
MKPLLFKTLISFWMIGWLQGASAQMPPALVTVAPVESQQMAPLRKIAAYSKAKYITTIKAETSGRVIELASIGEQVETGESLGLIADETYALRITELKNAITSEQANLDFLESESKRLQSLSAKNLTSQSALDKNKSDLLTSKAKLAQAQSRLAQLQDSISKLNPKAPFNAFVTEQFAQPGQYIDQGQNFLRIMSRDQTEIIAHLPVKFKQLIQGGKIWQYQNQSGQIFEAKVTGYVPAATSNSRQMQVHLSDLSDQLIPGEAITLLVPETEPKTVIAVHRDALVYRRQGASVFIIKDNTAHKIDVETGLAQGHYIQINGNIKPGDSVVIRGNERLRDQQSVELGNN